MTFLFKVIWNKVTFHRHCFSKFLSKRGASKKIGKSWNELDKSSVNTNQQDALFSLIYFNNNPLHVSSRLAALHQEDQLFINNSWYSHALCWLTAGRIGILILTVASQHSAWHVPFAVYTQLIIMVISSKPARKM
jgi:hypothetical protein